MRIFSFFLNDADGGDTAGGERECVGNKLLLLNILR